MDVNNMPALLERVKNAPAGTLALINLLLSDGMKMQLCTHFHRHGHDTFLVMSPDDVKTSELKTALSFLEPDTYEFGMRDDETLTVSQLDDSIDASTTDRQILLTVLSKDFIQRVRTLIALEPGMKVTAKVEGRDLEAEVLEIRESEYSMDPDIVHILPGSVVEIAEANGLVHAVEAKNITVVHSPIAATFMRRFESEPMPRKKNHPSARTDYSPSM